MSWGERAGGRGRLKQLTGLGGMREDRVRAGPNASQGRSGHPFPPSHTQFCEGMPETAFESMSFFLPV